NYDQGVGLGSDDCGCAYRSDHEKQMGSISIAYTNSVIGDDERQYLRTLPAHINVEFRLNEQKLNLLLVHGSPRRINEYLFEDRDEKSMVRMMEAAGADIMCFGHTHKPYHRVFAGTKHAINTGSVGKPKDGDPRGCYVMLSIDERNNVSVQFVRFEYDVEKAARGIENSPLPNEYAAMLRGGV
ncbi:MAG TPA: metallophosphoesterase family protein, partial [Chitinophagaceae bacterium]|nr:metallophosphoesterase family protein [Chitinophagaceae bacterium]